jgi:hypothetical protein
MGQATAWAATLAMCTFILFTIYGGVLPQKVPGSRAIAETALHRAAHRIGTPGSAVSDKERAY